MRPEIGQQSHRLVCRGLNVRPPQLIDIDKAIDKVHQDQGAPAPDAAGPAQTLMLINSVFIHGHLKPAGHLVHDFDQKSAPHRSP